ncbi:5'-3' exonuclease H3TH domain-containing protein [Mycoplasma marinum]|uniref:5'-3' exonuclease n=1 Tax=Mycoplasma marinum TaxID=1937190 RepID=A0A4R0XTX9_9MOLU|nr:5'-3' exonuclease H3TH domain-containing protein [Mycoplasma marinum]TCG11237.1 hypothetical protein C4B24_02655 [Mycoplasma marinum]
MNKLLLIDGNSLTYRGYYATAMSPRGILTTSDGIPTNAILSMNNMLSNIIYAEKPSHIMIAFDAAKKTNRHELFPEYKGGRSKTPEELIQQFPLIKDMIAKMGIKWYEQKGWEADDIIATLAKKASNSGMNVRILSSDKDLLQLVDENTQILFNNKGVKDLKVYTEDNFFEFEGHYPNQVPDMKGIVGDASDNLPGVKGIGAKGANKLLEKYTTLDSVYENINDITGKVQEKLIRDKKIALLCRDIATLNYDVEIPFDFPEMKYKFSISQELLVFFKRYELNSLIKKFSKYANGFPSEEEIIQKSTTFEDKLDIEEIELKDNIETKEKKIEEEDKIEYTNIIF